MSFLVAGVMWVLALVIGVMSYISIPFFAERTNEDDGENVEYKITPAALPQFFTKGNLKQVIFVCAAALLCAAAAFISHKSGNSFFYIVKQSVVALMFLSAMIVDKDTHKIPNILVLVGFICGIIFLVVEFFISRNAFVPSLVSSVVGCCGCLVLFYILARLTKEGIGMGDVKLIATVGWILGLASAIFIVLASMILCSLYAIFLLVGKRKNKNDTLPFGPFLFFGYIILLLLINI